MAQVGLEGERTCQFGIRDVMCPKSKHFHLDMDNTVLIFMQRFLWTLGVIQDSINYTMKTYFIKPDRNFSEI